MRDRLVTILNDRNQQHACSLREAISNLPGIDSLRNEPKVFTFEVGEEIARALEKISLIPALFFVDPWGYKGLSLRLVNSVLKDWGCDCIFFFNYNRINMGLNNAIVQEHMTALFGRKRADELRGRLELLSPTERELLIIEELCAAVRELGPRYVLPFCFKDGCGVRTSHHLVFVSKARRGYEIMKEIMAGEGTSVEGVPSFEYNPVDNRLASRQQLLFSLSRPLDDLGDMLLREFAGQTLTVKKVYERHSVDRPYIKRNYKSILRKLESDGKIRATPHRRGTLGDDVSVTFPMAR